MEEQIPCISLASKEVLLKAVLGALPTYIIKDQDQNIIHWKSWESITLPKEIGGLGFKDLQTFNKALIFKQLWRLLSQPNLLVSRVLKGLYYPKESFFRVKQKRNCSWLWGSLMKLRDSFHSGLKFEVKNWLSIKIWDLPWVPRLPRLTLTDRNPSSSHITWAETKAILKITNIDPLQSDRIRWDRDKKGVLTMASTYSKLIAQKWKKMDLAESSTNQQELKQDRRRSWRMHAKGKLMHFLHKLKNTSSSIVRGLNLFGNWLQFLEKPYRSILIASRTKNPKSLGLPKHFKARSSNSGVNPQ
ncbi:RNA-directed DNA polymerase (reversetranscriptase)-related family protein [Striga asiatica]|uniref:RNA-directed DNA polymerase (Reversetranscriptase)-related family protein n=1 Tax=Striga asiatica TaxID=4170 RepID=A0A5A7Q0C0_STRAF|nr:RNA-directed DNA polymerase (reversetranscriptase)-related family protein [Striga asiatica]